MKYFILLVVVLLAAGCSQGPDFSNPAIVVKKEKVTRFDKYSPDVDSCYFDVDSSNGGVRGSGEGAIRFIAPCKFADIGDVLIAKDGIVGVMEN